MPRIVVRIRHAEDFDAGTVTSSLRKRTKMYMQCNFGRFRMAWDGPGSFLVTCLNLSLVQPLTPFLLPEPEDRWSIRVILEDRPPRDLNHSQK